MRKSHVTIQGKKIHGISISIPSAQYINNKIRFPRIPRQHSLLHRNILKLRIKCVYVMWLCMSCILLYCMGFIWRSMKNSNEWILSSQNPLKIGICLVEHISLDCDAFFHSFFVWNEYGDDTDAFCSIVRIMVNTYQNNDGKSAEYRQLWWFYSYIEWTKTEWKCENVNVYGAIQLNCIAQMKFVQLVKHGIDMREQHTQKNILFSCVASCKPAVQCLTHSLYV